MTVLRRRNATPAPAPKKLVRKNVTKTVAPVKPSPVKSQPVVRPAQTQYWPPVVKEYTPDPFRATVPLDKRKPGWPRLDPRVTHTQYVGSKLKCIGFVTETDRDYVLAWDMCGKCKRYITRCKCPNGVTPPRHIVVCFRKANKIPVEPIQWAPPFVALEHDQDGKSTGIYTSPPNRPVMPERKAAPIAAPRKLVRRMPVKTDPEPPVKMLRRRK